MIFASRVRVCATPSPSAKRRSRGQRESKRTWEKDLALPVEGYRSGGNDNLIEVITNHNHRSPSQPKLHVIHLQSVRDYQVVDLIQQTILVEAGVIHP